MTRRISEHSPPEEQLHKERTGCVQTSDALQTQKTKLCSSAFDGGQAWVPHHVQGIPSLKPGDMQQPGPASQACDWCSHMEPHLQKAPVLDLMLCCCHLESFNNCINELESYK